MNPFQFQLWRRCRRSRKVCSVVFPWLCCLSLVFFGSPIFAQNLVVNGGFNFGSTVGWSGAVPTSAVVQTLHFQDGIADGCWIVLQGDIFQTIATTPGDYYEFSFWTQTSDSSQAFRPNSITAFWGSTLACRVFCEPFQPQWVHYVTIVRAENGSTRIRFSSENGPYLDGVKVVRLGSSLSPGQMTVPADGAVFREGESISMESNWSGRPDLTPSSTISYYANVATRLGSVTGADRPFVWTNVAPGIYYISAGFAGYQTPAVQVIVETRPKIQLVQPAMQSVFAPGEAVHWTVRLRDNRGPDAAVQVRFIVNGTVVQIQDVPGEFLGGNWNPPGIGDYVVTAIGVRSDGSETLRAEATIHVLPEPVLDQTLSGSDSYAYLRSRLRVAQTFIAGVSGRLHSIELGVSQANGALDDRILVEIRDVVDGHPGTNLLGATSLTLAEAYGSEPAHPLARFSFPSNHIVVTAGNFYAFVVEAIPPLSSQPAAPSRLVDVYRAGNLWYDTGEAWKSGLPPSQPVVVSDFIFNTLVSPATSPVVRLTTPVPQSRFPTGSSIPIRAITDEMIATTKRVVFFGDGRVLGAKEGAPFDYQWENVPDGGHTLVVRADGVDGGVSESEPVSVIVGATDEGLPRLRVEDTYSPEGDRSIPPLVFRLRLSTNSAAPVSVRYRTHDLTAIAPISYLPADGIVTFQPGQTDAVVFVRMVGDLKDELNQRMWLELFEPHGAILERPAAVGVILDDEWGRQKVAGFTWDLGTNQISGDQELPVTLIAIDPAGAPVTDVAGSVRLEAVIDLPDVHTIFGDQSPTDSQGFSQTTEGYSLVPTTDLVVTHLRCMGAERVSLWDDQLHLMAVSEFTYQASTWQERELISPVRLKANVRYRIGAYSSIYKSLPRVSERPLFVHGYIESGLFIGADAYPDTPTFSEYRLVDFRYRVAGKVVGRVAPGEVPKFNQGRWSGSVKLAGADGDLRLLVTDSLGRTGWSPRFHVEANSAPATPPKVEPVVAPPPGVPRSIEEKVGTPMAWGLGGPILLPAHWTNLVQLVAANHFMIGRTVDGRLLACSVGGGVDGRQATPEATPEAATNLTSVAAGYSFGYAVRADGILVGWGMDAQFFQAELTRQPVWLTNALAVSCGYGHSVAITSDGYMVGWGLGQGGVIEPPYDLPDPVEIYSGQDSSLVRLRNGEVHGWGISRFGELTLPFALRTAESLAVSPFGHVLALRSDGTVVAWGSKGQGQAKVPPPLVDVVQVAVGSYHSLALTKDGIVVGWGGDGADFARTPTNVARLFAVAAGENFSCGLTLGPVPAGPPQTMTVAAGSDVVLTAEFRSVTPYSARWRYKGKEVGSSEEAGLRLANLQARDAGQYTRVATNEFGTVESVPITLVIQSVAPRFVVQPESVAVLLGNPLALRGEARGTEPMQYQWLLNGSEIPGATNQFLTIPAVRSLDRGAYQLSASNSSGSSRSDSGFVSTGVPEFLEPLRSGTLLEGMTGTLQTTVIAPESPVFQWWFNGRPLEAETTLSLVRSNFVAEMAGTYWLVATNSFGASTSVLATLDFQLWPTPMLEPSLVVDWRDSVVSQNFKDQVFTNAVAVAAGGLFNLALLSDGTVTTWSPNSSVLSENFLPPESATNVVEIAAGVNHGVALRSDGTVVGWGGQDGRDFRQIGWPAQSRKIVHVTAGYGFSLALQQDGTLLEWPEPSHVPAGLDQVVRIASSDSRNLAQRIDNSVWYWENQNSQTIVVVSNLFPRQLSFSLFGGLVLERDGRVAQVNPLQRDELALPDVIRADPVAQLAFSGTPIWLRTESGRVWGQNFFETAWRPAPPNLVGVTQLSGGSGSLVATTRTPYVIAEPEATTVLKGSPIHLTVNAASPTPLRYQWRRDGKDLAGQTNQTLDIASARFTDQGQYAVRLANDTGGVETQPISLTVNGTPDVVFDSDTQFVPAGTNISLIPTIRGPSPFVFQWFHGSEAISGATADTLGLVNAQGSDSGDYFLRAANGFGSSTSAVFHLQVTPAAPRILGLSTALNVREGELFQLSAVVRGSEPIFFQWQQDGRNLPGETNPVLFQLRARSATAGIYALLISNAVASVSSPPIPVEVQPVPAVLGQFPRWQVVNDRESLILAPTFESSNPVARQWYRFDKTLPNETNSTLRLNAVRAEESGDYFLRLTNEFGTIDAGPMHLAVRPDSWIGALVGWGTSKVPEDLDLVTALSVGREHTLAVDQNGAVHGWGRNDRGQASPPYVLGRARSVSAGIGFSVALLQDGSVAAWGDNRQAQTQVPTNLGPIVAIASGSAHTLVLRRDGTVTGWGSPVGRVLNIPVGLSNVVAISANGLASVALRENGEMVGWGAELPNPPGGFGVNLTSIAMGQRFVVAVDRTGQAMMWDGVGRRSWTGGTNALSVSAGSAHALALRSDGTVVGLGSNLSGQLNTPTDLSEVVAVFAGGDGSLAATRKPVVVAQPVARSVAAGGEVQLAVRAVGVGPLAFQWFKNGQLLPDETNSILHRTVLAVADGGSFGVRITNSFGSVASASAPVTVLEPVRFRGPIVKPSGLEIVIPHSDLPAGSLWESTDLIHWTLSMPIPAMSNLPDLHLVLERSRTNNFYRFQIP